MKKVIKVMEFISSAINALLGSLASIGFIEVINVIISICMGQYVRMDGGNLELIIEDYIALGLYGYGLAWIFIYCNKLNKDENKDIIQRSKEVIIVSWIIIVLINFICGILLSDFIEALMMNIMYSAMFGFALFILYIWDVKVINKINDKIKENKDKKQ